MLNIDKITHATIAVKAYGKTPTFGAYVHLTDAQDNPGIVIEVSGLVTGDTIPKAHCRALYHAIRLAIREAPFLQRIVAISDNPASSNAPSFAVDWLAKGGKNSIGYECAFPKEHLSDFVEMTHKVPVMGLKVAKDATAELKLSGRLAAGHGGTEGIQAWKRQALDLAA